MRKLSSITKSILLGVAAAALLSGCASTDRYDRPLSTLSFSPVTDTEQLVMWHTSFRNIRSIERYVMTAPAEMDADVNLAGLPTFDVDLPPGALYIEAAGGPADVDVNADAQVRRVFLHAPHQQ